MDADMDMTRVNSAVRNPVSLDANAQKGTGLMLNGDVLTDPSRSDDVLAMLRGGRNREAGKRAPVHLAPHHGFAVILDSLLADARSRRVPRGTYGRPREVAP